MALHPGKPATLTLLLPSRPGGPLASPELVRGGGRAVPPRGGPTLRPWSVPALLVDIAELDDPVDEVRYGASVAHLRAVAELAADLAARGRVLPTLVRNGSLASARWRPIVQGLDAVTFDALVAALPPVGRAETVGPARGPQTGGDAQELVTDALAGLTDAAVRDRLARAPEPVTVLPPRPGTPHRLAATEAWLAALLTPDGRIGGGSSELPATELAALADAVAQWDEFGTAPTGAGRACFRLSEISTLHDPADPTPDALDQTGDGTRWVLEFLLQSTADPSLLVPAEQVWSGGAARLIAEPQELLLAELGRASLVLPALAPALRQARPSTLDLDLDGAHHFLTAGAALLVEAGFGVQLPSGWDGARRVGLALSARSTPADRVLTRSGLGREELADFRWSIAVGDEELSEEELTDLVATKAPLVRLRGRWVSVDAERLQKGLEFLRRARQRRAAGAPTAAEVLALAHRHPDDWAAGGEEDGVPLPVTAIHAEGWIGQLLSGEAERAITPIPPPPGFQAQLRPYQERGVSWLAFLSALGLGACLADDMGLGKTVQMLALETHERAQQEQGPTLLICPMSLVGTWQREAARFAPRLRVLAHHGPGRLHGEELAERVRESDLVVTTYATATRDGDELARFAWRRLVLDEAQDVKNAAPRTPGRCGASTPSTASRSPARPWRTGSPSCGRSWTCSTPGCSAPPSRFRARYAIPVERHGDTEAAALLRRVTRPVPAAAAEDRPDDHRRPARQDRDHAALPAHPRAGLALPHGRRRHDGEDRRLPGHRAPRHVLAAMAKLKQVCNHPAQLLHDGSPVGRPLRQAPPARGDARRDPRRGRPRAVLHAVRRVGPHARAAPVRRASTPRSLFLHGGTPKKRRDEMVARFQAGDGPADLAALAQGRRHRPQPHRRQPRLPFRPLVEPRRREPGHRPRVPHRAAAQRPGAQVRLPGHRRGDASTR